MNKRIEDLILTLTKEQEIYQMLVEIAEDKKTIIIESKVKELEKLTAKEQGLAMSLMKLEDLRGRIVDDLLKDMGLTKVETITELINYLEPDEKIRLGSVKNQLQQVVGLLKDKNQLNGQLIEQSLRYIEFNMSLMAGLEEDNKYSKSAKEQQTKQRKNLFDVKV